MGIRQNAGMCTIQWTESVVTGTADAFDFNANANIANAQHGIAQCVNGAAGIAGKSYVQIPGTTIYNLATAGAIQSGAVIATGVPFEIRIVSLGDANAEAGASLQATQVPCGVNPTG